MSDSIRFPGMKILVMPNSDARENIRRLEESGNPNAPLLNTLERGLEALRVAKTYAHPNEIHLADDAITKLTTARDAILRGDSVGATKAINELSAAAALLEDIGYALK